MSESSDFSSQVTSQMGKLEKALAPIFAKAPHLPADFVKILVDIAPWLALVFGVLGLFGLLTAGAVSVALSPLILLAGGISGVFLFVHLAISVVSVILDLLAFNPLRAHKKKGWNYLFYASVLSAISMILAFFVSSGSIGGLIGTVIGFWLLFEIRPRYS